MDLNPLGLLPEMKENPGCFFFFAALFFLFFPCLCSANGPDIEPPARGNFALPPSQQPGPLIAFGQNVLPRGQTQFYLYADDYAGSNRHTIEMIPSILYGITDSLSLFLNAPYALSNKQASNYSSGFEDAFVQLEYSYFSCSNPRFTELGTIVFNITAPTGSIHKTPPTGVGSPSFFFGTTFNRTYVDWTYFVSPGATFTTAKNGTKFGNTYLYQAGFGRNIKSTHQWLFAWMLEGDGSYTQKNRISGVIDPNSGGNVIYLTPSIFVSNNGFIFQLGAGWPLTQHLNGVQGRDSYLLAASLGFRLN